LKILVLGFKELKDAEYGATIKFLISCCEAVTLKERKEDNEI
jgi:hypothetical protein